MELVQVLTADAQDDAGLGSQLVHGFVVGSVGAVEDDGHALDSGEGLLSQLNALDVQDQSAVIALGLLNESQVVLGGLVGAVSNADDLDAHTLADTIVVNGGNLLETLGGVVHAVANGSAVQAAGNEGLLMTEENGLAAQLVVAEGDGLHGRSSLLGEAGDSVRGEVGALIQGQSALSDLHAESHAGGAAAFFTVRLGGELKNIETFECHSFLPPYCRAETSSEIALADSG